MERSKLFRRALPVIAVISLTLATSVQADPANAAVTQTAPAEKPETNNERRLKKMKASRHRDQTHKTEAQKELNAGRAKLSSDRQSHQQNISDLESLDSQVRDGRNQQKVDREAY